MQVKVDAIVHFQVLDHFSRRLSSTSTRVVGALLGSRNPETGLVTVRNSFPVTSEQLDEDDGFSNNIQMYRRISPKDAVVGWYIPISQILGIQPTPYARNHAAFTATFPWRLTIQTPTLHLSPLDAIPWSTSPLTLNSRVKG